MNGGGGDALFRKLMIHQTAAVRIRFEIPLIKRAGEVVYRGGRNTSYVMIYYYNVAI